MRKKETDAVSKEHQSGLAVLKAAKERGEKHLNIVNAKLKLVKQEAALEKEKMMKVQRKK